MTGGFPGFMAGWMHVPDYPPHEGWPHLGEAQGACRRWAWRRLLPTGRPFFAGDVASVMIYYWYRLPSLIGFSMFPDGDEMLVDLRHSVPLWFLRPASSGIWMPRLRIGKHA